MRLKIDLVAQNNSFITIHYYYQVFVAIYDFLYRGSPKFAAFLHDQGYEVNNRSFKLFTFALRFKEYKIASGRIYFISPNATLFISSPLINDFFGNLLIGVFEKAELIIKGYDSEVTFKTKFAEVLPPPGFKYINKFKFLSPMVLSPQPEKDIDELPKYIRPDELDSINRLIKNNLLQKLYLMSNEQISDTYFKFYWDEEYLKSKKRITKMIHIIKVFDRPSNFYKFDKQHFKPIKIIGMEAPFYLECDPLLKLAGYECGFGINNSMGFGMADVI